MSLPAQVSGNTRTQQRRKRLQMWRAILLVLIVIAMIQFLYRGPMRMGHAYDLAAIYSPARAWLHGNNPYNPDHVADALQSARYDGRPMGIHARTAVYPPPTYFVMAPLAAMDWPSARHAWLLINLVAMGLIVWQCFAIVKLVGGRPPRGHLQLALVAGLLLLAPFHTSFALGQTAILATLLVLASFHASLAQRNVVAGLLAGLAFALKPQMGVVALAYLIARFRWRSGLMALLVVALCWLGAVTQLQAHAPGWWSDLQANMAAFNRGGVGDMSRHGRVTHHFLSIHTLVHRYVDHRALVTAMAVALGAVVTLLGMRRVQSHSTPRAELLFISLLAVACLLTAPGQRFYGATLLILPLLFVLLTLFDRRRWPALPPSPRRRSFVLSITALCALAVFAVPGAATLVVLADEGYVPTMLTDTLFWRNVLILQGIWALMVLLATLLAMNAENDPPRIAR